EEPPRPCQRPQRPPSDYLRGAASREEREEEGREWKTVPFYENTQIRNVEATGISNTSPDTEASEHSRATCPKQGAAKGNAHKISTEISIHNPPFQREAATKTDDVSVDNSPHAFNENENPINETEASDDILDVELLGASGDRLSVQDCHDETEDEYMRYSPRLYENTMPDNA
ncbi:hypothetical protein BaRGS_00039392, partial [Batillaria attramentaria]